MSRKNILKYHSFWAGRPSWFFDCGGRVLPVPPLLTPMNKSTVRDTNARHFLGLCGSCWFQQDGATVHTTIRARSWLKSRFGRKSSAASPSTRGEPGVRICPPPPPGLLVLERGHDRAQKKTPTSVRVPIYAGWAERNHGVLRPVNGRKSRYGVYIRRYGVPAAELAPAWSVTELRLRGDNSGPDSVVLPDTLSISHCDLSAEKAVGSI